MPQNAECVNSEGLKSWHLADGGNPTFLTGTDYNGVYPVWNWRQIPGTTEWMGGSPNRDGSVSVTLGMGSTSVGGVSTGLYGAAGMLLLTGTTTM